jgi:methyltransferase
VKLIIVLPRVISFPRQLLFMFQVPRRQQRITVALPASFSLDIPHLREKTARIGFVARALAIFRVEHVLLYKDQNSEPARREGILFEKILRFLETPPYLRRELFQVDPDLAFTGVLPPLRTASHPDRSTPESGVIREAIVKYSGEVSQVNAGFKELVTVNSRLKPRTRITIRLKTVRPELIGELVNPAELSIYWGIQVTREERALGQILKRSEHDLTISTSREGTDVREVTEPLRERWRKSKTPLILFGSPSEGVPKILAKSNDRLPTGALNINTMPGQGTETIRTEEALLGTLTALNMLTEM